MFKTIKYGFEESQRSFDLIPYKSWQEREILLAVSLNEEEFTTNGIDKIFEYLTTNIIPKENYDISKEEKIYLLYMLRSISIGESINTKNICSECNKPFDTELEINDFLKPPKEFNKTLSIDNFTLYFKDTFRKSEIEELESVLGLKTEQLSEMGRGDIHFKNVFNQYERFLTTLDYIQWVIADSVMRKYTVHHLYCITIRTLPLRTSSKIRFLAAD